MASEAAAKASVIAPASTNQRFRWNKLIRFHFMDKSGDSKIAFGLKMVTMVTNPENGNPEPTESCDVRHLGVVQFGLRVGPVKREILRYA